MPAFGTLKTHLKAMLGIKLILAHFGAVGEKAPYPHYEDFLNGVLFAACFLVFIFS